MSGSVNINNCNFTHNNHYNHDTAIHYSSILSADVQLVFAINNCIYDNNQGLSIVYFHQPGSALPKYLSLQSSKLSKNYGVPMYIINSNYYVNGVVLFEENNATNSGGLFDSDHVSFIFNDSSVVKFSRNIANNQDGPVFVSNQVMISFEQNSILVFNIAGEGGAVYSESNITIKENSQIMCNDNSAINGRDIACYSKCTFCWWKTW